MTKSMSIVNEINIKKRTNLDKLVRKALLAITIICSASVLLIGLFISMKGIEPFLKKYEINGDTYQISFFRFITGDTWLKKPATYGAGFIILNTIYVSFLALLIVTPLAIFSSLFIAKIAPKVIAKSLRTIIELLSGIPSVIFGLFGIGIIVKIVDKLGNLLGIQTAGGLSTLSTALVLACMIFPTITIISIESIQAVNPNIELGSLALGATKTQTNFKVVLKASKSGIFSGMILGIGRALGEATAVSMVCGNSGAHFTFDLFSTTRTLTSTMLLGFHDTTGVDYDIRFSVGILLMAIIILTNLSLNYVKNRIGNVHEK